MLELIKQHFVISLCILENDKRYQTRLLKVHLTAFYLTYVQINGNVMAMEQIVIASIKRNTSLSTHTWCKGCNIVMINTI